MSQYPWPLGRRDEIGDGRGEAQVGEAAVVLRAPEGVDGAVVGDDPVAAAVGRRAHRDGGTRVRERRGGTEEGRVEPEDTAVLGDEPVARAVRGLRHPDDRRREREALRRTEERRRTEGVDHVVVAVERGARGRGRERDSRGGNDETEDESETTRRASDAFV